MHPPLHCLLRNCFDSHRLTLVTQKENPVPGFTGTHFLCLAIVLESHWLVSLVFQESLGFPCHCSLQPAYLGFEPATLQQLAQKCLLGCHFVHWVSRLAPSLRKRFQAPSGWKRRPLAIFQMLQIAALCRVPDLTR